MISSPVPPTYSMLVKTLSPSGTDTSPFPEQSTPRSALQRHCTGQGGGEETPLGPPEEGELRSRTQADRAASHPDRLILSDLAGFPLFSNGFLYKADPVTESPEISEREERSVHAMCGSPSPLPITKQTREESSASSSFSSQDPTLLRIQCNCSHSHPSSPAAAAAPHANEPRCMLMN